MRLISNRALVVFYSAHPDARASMTAWRKVIETGSFRTFAELKQAFRSVDRVGGYYVFNVGGNNFRIVAAVHFNRQYVYIREVLTHKEYDRWIP